MGQLECLAAAASVATFIMRRPGFGDLAIIESGEVLHGHAMGTRVEFNRAGRHRAFCLANYMRLLTEGVHF